MDKKIALTADTKPEGKAKTINELGDGLRTLNIGRVEEEINLDSLLRISRYTSCHCVQ